MPKTTKVIAVSLKNGNVEAMEQIALARHLNKSRVYDEAVSLYIEYCRNHPDFKEINLGPREVTDLIDKLENKIGSMEKSLTLLIKQKGNEELKKLDKRLDNVERSWGLKWQKK